MPAVERAARHEDDARQRSAQRRAPLGANVPQPAAVVRLGSCRAISARSRTSVDRGHAGRDRAEIRIDRPRGDNYMDIAIIAPPWLPVPAPAYGGTEAVLDELARGLQNAGHEVLMVCHPDSQCPVPKASVVPAEDTVAWVAPASSWSTPSARTSWSSTCDVVHDHTLAGPVYSARYPDLPVVTTNHNPFTRTYNARLRRRRATGRTGRHLAVARRVDGRSDRRGRPPRHRRRRLTRSARATADTLRCSAAWPPTRECTGPSPSPERPACD